MDLSEKLRPFQENNSLNFFRLIFSLYILIGHSFQFSFVYNPINPYFDLHIGVCVFFLLSGFWVTKSFITKKDTQNLKQYFISRFIRIYPFYFFVVISAAFISVIFSSLSFSEYFTNKQFYKYLFFNLITLNFFAESLPGCYGDFFVNGSLWTIKIEIGFYLILPVIIFILEKLNTRKNQNIFLLVCICISSLFYNTFTKFYTANYALQKIANQFPGYASYFLIGIFILLNWDMFLKYKTKLAFISLLFFIAHFFTKTELLLPFSLTFLLFFLGDELPFLNKVGKKTDYSYGIYLTHYPLINIFRELNLFSKNLYLSTLCIILISLLITFLFENFIQKPIINKYRP